MDDADRLDLLRRVGGEDLLQGRLVGAGAPLALDDVDVEAQARWVDYAEAKDQMFAYTDTRESPWYVVDAEDKRTARLNLMSHLLSVVPYQPIEHDDIVLPPLQHRAYVRPPLDSQTFVPQRYAVEGKRSAPRS